MGLGFYDSSMTPFGISDVLRAKGDGHLGDIHEEKLYVRNDDVTKYYTNISLTVYTKTFAESGVVDDASWSIKLMYGERQPTEKEWSTVIPDASVAIPDVGASGNPDTSTYHPVWVRVYIPGGVPAQYRLNKTLRLYRQELPA